MPRRWLHPGLAMLFASTVATASPSIPPDAPFVPAADGLVCAKEILEAPPRGTLVARLVVRPAPSSPDPVAQRPDSIPRTQATLVQDLGRHRAALATCHGARERAPAIVAVDATLDPWGRVSELRVLTLHGDPRVGSCVERYLARARIGWPTPRVARVHFHLGFASPDGRAKAAPSKSASRRQAGGVRTCLPHGPELPVDRIDVAPLLVVTGLPDPFRALWSGEGPWPLPGNPTPWPRWWHVGHGCVPWNSTVLEAGIQAQVPALNRCALEHRVPELPAELGWRVTFSPSGRVVDVRLFPSSSDGLTGLIDCLRGVLENAWVSPFVDAGQPVRRHVVGVRMAFETSPARHDDAAGESGPGSPKDVEP